MQWLLHREKNAISKQLLSVFLFGLLLIYGFFVPLAVSAAPVAKKINDANKLYFQGEYDQALELYNEALVKARNLELLNFNTAAAYYKKEDYEKAKELFAKALTARDKSLESKAAFNIGNCLFRQSQLKQKDDLKHSVDYLNEALSYYQRSIELDDKDEDAKFNYELADRKLEEARQELKNQQKQKKEEGDKKQQESQQQAGSQGAQQREEENKTPLESSENKQGQEQEEQQDTKENQDREEKEKEIKENNSQQSTQEPREMNEEEAKMLINAYAHEGLRLDLSDRHSSANEPAIDKDW